MIALVLGGARSGKSAFAESLAGATGGPVTYVATAAVVGDPDFDERVRRHRVRRPATWSTVETGPDLEPYLVAHPGGTVLIDSLGTWLVAHTDFVADRTALCRAIASRSGDTILVSEEVGLGVHPATEVGGRFRDALGELNQAVAAIATHAYLIVAGRALVLEPPPGAP